MQSLSPSARALLYLMPTMDVRLFDYDLPADHIAQIPVSPRDASRLLVLHRESGEVTHAQFRDLPDFLEKRDLLVTNDTRVMPARLRARKDTGGRADITLLRPLDAALTQWSCLIRGSQIQAGRKLFLQHPSGTELKCEVLAADNSGGERTIQCAQPLDPPTLRKIGQLPLPPYIKEYAGPQERYQTVYARQEGSVAAPTAGLHFTPELLDRLQEETAGVASVTLHVSQDTFAPVRSAQVEAHGLKGEQAEVSQQCAQAVQTAKDLGGRILSVGTTSTRTLEWAARQSQSEAPTVQPASGLADLYIYPGFEFHIVDALVTNLHLPMSTPMFMVSAFIGAAHSDPDAGRRMLLGTYLEAQQKGYRFYSFGDAMLIL